uniref:Cytochrome P450 monooxygenase CYP333A13 n=1 Tax=Cnaphalocrocis medinalis TaxID=437488 RepID=A0A0C5C1L2_CNAME|nr:cytochrome P450 monooxygenase CYP333A13 [Cnaphalocrocis medinalis]
MKLVRILIQPFGALRSQCFRELSTQAPRPFKDVPGLAALPIIGSWHRFLPILASVGMQANFFKILSAMRKKYGPIVKWEGFGGRGTMVICFNPKDFDQVYRAEETNPLRPGFVSLEYFREVLHKEKFQGVYGLTTAQGDQWRDFRTKVNPALLKIKMVQLYAPGLEEIAEDSIARLLKMTPKEISQDFYEEATKWSLESVALIALGSRIGCLENNPADHPSQQLIYCARKALDLPFILELMPTLWKDKTKTALFKKILDIYDLQWKVSEEFIDQTKKRIKERGHDIPEEDQSILEKLLAIDEKVAVMMANEMLMAGIDTVAFSLTGILYQLAMNPGAQDKVREEIRQGKSARYLKACLKESLRLAPVVSANLRVTSKDHVVGGYLIPKGVSLVAPNEILSKSEEHYPRATEFLPERWIVEKSDPLYHGNTHPMVTLPFGFGVRSCIGRRIAELELEVFVKKLLDKVRVSWSGPPIQVTTRVMNTYKKPFSFKFEPVN